MKAIVGTWPLGGDFGNVALADVHRVLAAARDAGFQEFDTAPNYGRGFMEFALGKMFGGDSEVRINTKCGNIPFEGKSFDVADIRRSVEDSLVRLRRDSIHVLFLHNPRAEVSDYSPILKLMDELKGEGKIMLSGMSVARNFPYSDVVDLDEFDVVQDDHNLLYTSQFIGKLASSTRFMARSPLASGLLGGRITAETTFDEEDHRSGWLKGERLEFLCSILGEITARWEVPLPILARAFLLQNPEVYQVIFGVSRVSHVTDLAGHLASENISDETLRAIAEFYGSRVAGNEKLAY
jgi:aryl-alcohol dehydrogenase-like predicted oxidoreductase